MSDKPKDHPDFNDTLREGGEEAVRARILNFEEAKSKKKANGEGNGDDKQKESAGKEQAEEKEKQKQVDVLVKLAREKSSLLFHSNDGVTWADVNIDDHRETLMIRSRRFEQWLTVCYAEENATIPSSEAINQAIDLLDASAAIRGDKREVRVRVAGDAGDVYIDLCDDQWRAIKVTANGWSIVSNPPVRFRRPPASKPLPLPQRGGDIGLLRKYLNVASYDDFALIALWTTSALRPEGPYVVLAISGEHGSAKSTFCKILRSLTDPNAIPIKRPPREERDLFIAAAGSHVLAYDNSIPSRLSDTLCTISTEGGFATRRLYTNTDEQLFSAKRPVIVNGITNVVTAPDLADRAIFIGLDVIDDEHRKHEEEFWADFERDRPKIFGALLDAVAHGLKMMPSTKPQRLPRMADFAQWAMACEGALFDIGTFERAYGVNQQGGVEDALDADAVASAIRLFMAGQERNADGVREWIGTTKELMTALMVTVLEAVTKSREWPKNEKGLRECLKRAAPFLRRVGIHVAWARQRTNKGRLLTIRYQEDYKAPSQPSQPSQAPRSERKNNDIDRDGAGSSADTPPSPPSQAPSHPTEHRHEKPSTVTPSQAPSRNTPYESKGGDGSDGGDGVSHTYPPTAYREAVRSKPPPPDERVCFQCHDGKEPLTDHDGVLLHAECARFWFQDYPQNED